MIDIDKLKHQSVFSVLILIVSLLLPGFLLLFLFKKDLIIQIDNYQLTLLSIALSTPIYFINFILTIIILVPEGKWDIDERDKFNSLSAITGFHTIPVQYIALAIGYFANFNLKQEIFTIIVTQGIWFISAIVFNYLIDKKII